MIDIIKNIIANVLTALYQPFGCAIMFAFFFMCLYLFAQEYGWKVVVQHLLESFKTDILFRRVFLLAFYVAMILCRTLLNRNMWVNPVSNVIGIWGLFNENGTLTTEAVENLVLFIPFIILMFLAFREKIFAETVKLMNVLQKSVTIVFLFSLSIEFLQLFLRLGTFQLSDLFYNTLGGLIGGFIYWMIYKIRSRKSNKNIKTME